MKTLGLIGGTSWQSTQVYYRLLNEGVARRLGGLHSAPLLLASLDFAPVAEWQYAGQWEQVQNQLVRTVERLVAGGIDGLILTANTMHRYIPVIRERFPALPIIHIADATAAAIRAQGLTRVALLGTRTTMSEAFYRDILMSHGIESLVPTAAEQDDVHRIIFDELCRGIIRDDSRRTYQAIIAQLQAAGAQGVILGCTEIPLLVGPHDVAIPTFDTAAIHAAAAVEWMMS